jgi:two-component sensor histidine kinase
MRFKPSFINYISSSEGKVFWYLQIFGWLTLTILTYLALTLWYTTDHFWPHNIHGLLQSGLGIFFSLILRKVFLHQWNKPYIGRAIIGALSIILIAFLWTIMRVQLYLMIVATPQLNFEKPDWVFDKASIFFNFGVDGANAGEKTYYWDDISFGETTARFSVSSDQTPLNKSPQKIDLPLNFDQENVHYELIDFGGASSVIGADPSGQKGNVAITTKMAYAETWAGTTMSNNNGFANVIPITSSSSIISVWVYSSEAGTPVRLKLEDHDNGEHSAETETRTTKVNEWERLIFDFNLAASNNVYGQGHTLWKEFGGWYFTSLLIFLCWAASYHGIKYALLFQRERDEADSQAQQAKLLSLQASEAEKEAQLQMLRYQLNPHFMFNTLNAIYALIKLGDQDQGKNMVSKLAKFLRYSLNDDNEQLVSLSQELDTLNLYLDIEKVRFGERLNVEIDVEPAASLCLVPSFILQPLVENAIKYAILEQESGGTINITAIVRKEQLILTVSDNGPGADLINGQLPSPSGIGLCNTQQRLETLFAQQYTFSLNNLIPHGLQILMSLPYQKRRE